MNCGKSLVVTCSNPAPCTTEMRARVLARCDRSGLLDHDQHVHTCPIGCTIEWSDDHGE